MHNIICKLVLFRPKEDSILCELSRVLQEAGGQAPSSRILDTVSLQFRRMVELGNELSLEGNLWHNCLTWFLLTDENPFTLSREYAPDREDTLARLAKKDIVHLRELFRYDLASIGRNLLGVDYFDELNMTGLGKSVRGDVGALVSDMAKKLAEAPSDEDFYRLLVDHYAVHGVGIFGMGHAFRIEEQGHADLKPIYNEDPVRLDDLVGYDEQKEQLVRNTLAFLEGKPANNVLLYGDSGSGKSTCIRALLHEYYPKGLRLIELYKHQFKSLADVIAMVKTRNCKFILFIDDLSFEDFEIEYKFLKAVIEGGIEARPDNLLIYATSNRRHLIKETWNDRNDMEHNGDIHRSDTVEEKLSLANRFGLAINFSSPSRKEYHRIVRTLADRAGIVMEDTELFRKADAWEIRHGGVSGRAARQFINDLACTADN
ncbi:MAG: ATP-binding protein [Clostridia bacterium]|nr:ATP-binding protein [Clostridia bacterium]